MIPLLPFSALKLYTWLGTNVSTVRELINKVMSNIFETFSDTVIRVHVHVASLCIVQHFEQRLRFMLLVACCLAREMERKRKNL